MVRRLVAGLVVAGLAIGVWLLWPEGDVAASSTTAADATPMTVPATPTSASPPAITPDPSTTSTTAKSHVVETVEEAETILRELWFGWFEGIYNQDEDRIREVVATEEQIQAAIDQFGEMEFISEPPFEAAFESIEVLKANERCLSIFAELDFSEITGATTGGVHVFLRSDEGWVFISFWRDRGDLWENDCDARLS